MNSTMMQQRYKNHVKHFKDTELTYEQYCQIWYGNEQWLHNTTKKLNRYDKNLPHSISNTYIGSKEDTVLRSKYAQHKCMAKKRGIDFLLTYEQWLKIWQDSGHLHQRGRKKGGYVMSRYGDIGPYSVDNVYIQPCEDNVSQSNKTRKIVYSLEARKSMAMAQRVYKYICMDMNGNTIKEYTDQYAIVEDGFHKGLVKKVCRGERSMHRGFKWRRENM